MAKSGSTKMYLGTLRASKAQGLTTLYQKWQEANQLYLQARLAYDQARLTAQQITTVLRENFLRAKQRVKAATEAYYAYLQIGQPLTLTQLEESKLFSPDQIRELKAAAQALLKTEKSGRA